MSPLSHLAPAPPPPSPACGASSGQNGWVAASASLIGGAAALLPLLCERSLPVRALLLLLLLYTWHVPPLPSTCHRWRCSPPSLPRVTLSLPRVTDGAARHPPFHVSPFPFHVSQVALLATLRASLVVGAPLALASLLYTMAMTQTLLLYAVCFVAFHVRAALALQPSSSHLLLLSIWRPFTDFPSHSSVSTHSHHLPNLAGARRADTCRVHRRAITTFLIWQVLFELTRVVCTAERSPPS